MRLITRLSRGDIWVDDPASAYYNRLVNTSSVSKDWVSGENLIQASPYYNYALNLTYNADCVPGEGSAIFLHCFMDSSYKRFFRLHLSAPGTDGGADKERNIGYEDCYCRQ